jgi:probable rRNA maturation factor
VEIDDRQRRHAVDRARVRRAARRAHDLGGGRGGVISILLASDRRLRALNRSFRGIDRATDVLSFPAGGRGRGAGRHLGDVAISVETAARQARASGWRLPQVIDRLVAHGVLHLLGWDHEADRGQMMTLQGRVLRSLRRPGRR